MQPETAICKQFCDTLREHIRCGNAPALVTWFHVPNEGKRGKKYGGILKACGVLAGVPDYCFIHRKQGVAEPVASFLEMKAPGGRLSDSQQRFNQVCVEHGVSFGLAYSAADGIAWLEEQGIIGRKQ